MQVRQMPPALVGVSVADGALALRLTALISERGARVQPARSNLLSAGSCSGLVYDLAFWNEAAVARLREFRETFAGIPVFLYVPPQAGAGPLFQSCAVLPAVRIDFQTVSPAGERSVAGAGIHWLMATMPLHQVRQLLNALFQELPAGVDHFLRCSLRHVEREPAFGTRIDEVAAELRLTERTLERWCREALLPAPKRMLLWISMLYVTLRALRSRLTVRETAIRLGIDPKRLYQVRTELLHAPDGADGPPSADLDRVLIAFVQECRLPRGRVTQAMKAVG